MEQSAVHRRLERVLTRLYERDGELLELNAHEISISHKLAEHLQPEFPDHHVDCEYNRKGDTDETKVLRGLTACENIDSNEEERWIRPDVLVHERKIDCRNLLALEVKLTSGGDRACDLAKLEELKRETHDFRYDHALFVELPVGERYRDEQIEVKAFDDETWTDYSEAFAEVSEQ